MKRKIDLGPVSVVLVFDVLASLLWTCAEVAHRGWDVWQGETPSQEVKKENRDAVP